MSRISLVRVGPKSQVGQGIRKALDLISFEFPEKISRVAIKPNMCYYWHPSIGDTTSPLFVADLIDVLRERTASDPDISIVESDASSMKCKYAFRLLGYQRVAKEKDVKLVNLSKDNVEEIRVKVSGKSYNFLLPDTIKKADLFVNVPKIKYMPGTKISCALKNIFGCNPYPKKFKNHAFLDHAIVGLNKIMPSDLCVVDGIVVRGAYSLRLGLVIAGADPVAIDSLAAKMSGFNPQEIEHVGLAEREGLGTKSYESVGEDPEDFVRRFPTRDSKEKIMGVLTDFGISIAKKLRHSRV